MSNLGTFDPTTAEPRRGFDPLPNGWYLGQVVDSDVRDTRSGNGKYAKFEFEVVDGPFQGRKLFANINFQNQNPDAQRIGQAELAELTQATGCGVIRDTTELHFKPVLIKVGVRKDDRDQNEIKAYKPNNGEGAPASAQRAPAQQTRQAPPPQQHAAGGGNRPWAR